MVNLLQKPWNQRPLVSIAWLAMSFHLLRSWAKQFSSCSPALPQLTMSSIHSLHGLPLLFVPTTIPDGTISLPVVFPPAYVAKQSEFHPNGSSSSSYSFISGWHTQPNKIKGQALCSRSFLILMFHIFHSLFFTLSNWYVNTAAIASKMTTAVVN